MFPAPNVEVENDKIGTQLDLSTDRSQVRQ
jgi:hypothetical protein